MYRIIHSRKELGTGPSASIKRPFFDKTHTIVIHYLGYMPIYPLGRYHTFNNEMRLTVSCVLIEIL